MEQDRSDTALRVVVRATTVDPYGTCPPLDPLLHSCSDISHQKRNRQPGLDRCDCVSTES